MSKEFVELLQRFTEAVEGADYEGFAALFAEDAVYEDGFYGAFRGRAEIATMLQDHFWGTARAFKWEMRSPAHEEGGHTGYAHYFFSYDYFGDNPESPGKRVIFEGMSRFDFDGEGLISRYREVFDKGAVVSQLGFEPERIAKSAAKTAQRLRTSPDAKIHRINQAS